MAHESWNNGVQNATTCASKDIYICTRKSFIITLVIINHTVYSEHDDKSNINMAYK